MLKLLLVLIFSVSVQGQLSVTWNGTTITGPVLIYRDELPHSNTTTTIADPNGPGALICRSEDGSARVSWHYVVNGGFVRAPGVPDLFTALSAGGGMSPNLSQLIVNRANKQQASQEETAARNLNGLWHCRLNAVGQQMFQEQINVGLYTRGGGRGSITDVSISLPSSSFGFNPPTFILVGDTNGGPPTNFSWRRNGQVISDGQVITNNGSYEISIGVRETNNTAYEQSRYRSTLVVTGTLPGVYQYSATNSATTTTRTSTFTIESAPQPPTSLMAIQNGENRVQVSWTGPPGRYRVTVDPGGVSMENAISPQTITLQQPGVYNTSVTTAFSQHYGATAGPVQVTVRGPLPVNITATLLTDTFISASWTQPPFSFTPVDYTVTLTRVTGSGQVLCSTVEDSRPPVTIMPTITSMEFTGLQEFNVYRVSVTARFSEFNLSLTVPSSMEFTTLSASPTGAPRNVSATTTSRTINVSWTTIECIERNGVIIGYTVEFQEQGRARIPGEVVNRTFTASGLTPHTNYTFRVAGVNSNGTGPFTDTTIQTNEDILGVVSTLTAVPRFTSIVFTWSPPQHPNGVINAYEVTYRVNDTNSTTINTTDISTTHTIELGLNTRVSGISVRAYTSVGPGNATMHPDVATPQQPTPPIPLTVQAQPLSATTVNVSWENVTVPGIVSYTVYYRPTETMGGQSEQSVTVLSSESSVVIEDLMTNVEYQFQVAAIAELDGVMFHGERSPVAVLLTPTDKTPSTITLSTYTRNLSIAVVLTFLFTIILCAVMRLVEFAIHRARHSNRNKSGGVGTKQGAVYEEVDTNLRKEKDGGEMAMKKNKAYGPVTATQQPQDYIYAQPDEM